MCVGDVDGRSLGSKVGDAEGALVGNRVGFELGLKRCQ